MKFIKTFEELNPRFSSKEEQKAYYKAKALAEPVENRIISPDDLYKFNLPDEIIEEMKKWDIIVKSPYSNSFYDSLDVGWSSKPDGSFRVSDHWNFVSQDKKHCETTTKVPTNTHISLGQYDASLGKYKILKTVIDKNYAKKIKDAEERKRYLTSPEVIEAKKEFKRRILNDEIFGEVTIDGKLYKGLINKFSGNDLRIIDPNSREVIYTDNHLEEYVTLYDKDGNKVDNPFQEMKHIKTFEGLFDHFKSQKNWYLKLKLSDSVRTYSYNGINLVLNGFVAIRKETVDPYLSIISSISKHWNLIDNKIDLLSNYTGAGLITDELKSISSCKHRLEFNISDTKEVDPDMPEDIAKEIVIYVKNKFQDYETYNSHIDPVEPWVPITTDTSRIIKIGMSKNLERGYIKFIVYL